MAKNIITVSDASMAALVQAAECSVDMLNDMAVDPMWMSASDVRELATKSDEEISKVMSENAKEAYKNIDQLVELQIFLNAAACVVEQG